MGFIFKNLEVSLGNIIEYNSHLEKIYSWPKHQIKKKIGITKRYISDEDQNTSILAMHAIRKVLKKTNLSNVKFVISVTNTPTRVFPSLAHEVSKLISKSENFFCLGINAGCTGYVDALYLATKLIKKNHDVLIITSDTYSKFIDKNDKSIRPIFSDGASCTLLKYKKNKSWKIVDEFFETERNTIEHLEFKRKIKMNGPEVLSFAIKKVLKVIHKIVKKKKILLLAHQAGKIVMNNIATNLNPNVIIPTNFEKNGNLVSTSIPLLIKENFKLMEKNNEILISGFGVGLSHSHILLKKGN